MNWHLQDAKNNLSKVVRKAQSEGPQTLTVRGQRAAIIVSAEDYDRLAQKNPENKKSLAEFLLQDPDWDDETEELVNRRSKVPSREIDL